MAEVVGLFRNGTASRGDGEEPALTLTHGKWTTLARQAATAELAARMADVVVHDFNDYLTGIAGFAHLALRRTPSGDPIARDLNNIRIIADRGGRLLRGFSILAARVPTGATSININTVIAGVEEVLPLLIPQNVDMEIIPDPELDSIHADPSHIELTILFLVAHAYEAMREGGKLTLKTANVVCSADPEDSNCEATQVTLTVSDTGSDAQLFGASGPVEQGLDGQCFALSVVAAMVSQYKGRVEVLSRPAQGTTIAVYFPSIRRSSSNFAARG